MKAYSKYTSFLATFLLFGFYGFKSHAQNSVTLNIKLFPIQTLVVNPAQQDITLHYATKADYNTGVTSLQSDHLTIYSTSGFQVKVNTNERTANGIPLSTISIIPSSGSNPIEQSHVEYQEKSLSNEEQPIITSTTGGVNKNFNISYKGSGANMYIDYSSSATTETYSYDVVYTIVSQ